MSTILAILLVAFGLVVAGIGGALLRDLVVESRADAAQGRHELTEHARRPQPTGDGATTAAWQTRQHRPAKHAAPPVQAAVEPPPEANVQAPPPVYQPPYRTAAGSAAVTQDFGGWLAARNTVLAGDPLPAAANDEVTTQLPPVASARDGVR
ncbi:hypothetical protein AB0B63_18625 [Micromonospora sp. NPDC049081]|uniref:hypothetical protein n=1 Tax=Micromonospora sp. NPDC049081 TaxID=3155150 RepID=UPI0033F69DD4